MTALYVTLACCCSNGCLGVSLDARSRPSLAHGPTGGHHVGTGGCLRHSHLEYAERTTPAGLVCYMPNKIGEIVIRNHKENDKQAQVGIIGQPSPMDCGVGSLSFLIRFPGAGTISMTAQLINIHMLESSRKIQRRFV
ncbi:conserved hypothetical protein [Coccidioides posadasii str. Silveira]|uniref:Secreted protein n=1 Tax=Coccidioides posadasii (strain RMSCC 757 / Silveira) TaxID=443226 RepID=E9DJE9_COCPS|nr:conserved hypothetical protein [Coccidioides posadasii str. Silveira]